MYTNRLLWRKIGITLKFNIVFGVLLALFLLAGITSFFTLFTIRNAEEQINQSKDITKHVLEMDHGMERAHRLHRDFFVHYQRIGLQKAHEEYAQPSAREISRVIRLSNELKTLLFSKEQRDYSSAHLTDINLYLASAHRFAKTSIEAVELLTERAAPLRGVEPQLMSICKTAQAVILPYQQAHQKLMAGCSFTKDYIINRKRSFMQLALNELTDLRPLLDSPQAPLANDTRLRLKGDLDAFNLLSNRLLEIDLAIAGKFHDFYLQQQALQPISSTLIQLSRETEAQAERKIAQTRSIAITIIPLSTVIGIIILLFISRVVHNSITTVVLKLASAAENFRDGKLDTRINHTGQDELGQLAAIFNSMASSLHELINNLELLVIQRTSELAASEERFTQLVRELPNIAVQGFDCNRVITYWNRASEMLYGYSRDEAIGKQIDRLIFPTEDRESFVHAINRWCTEYIRMTAAEMMMSHKNGGKVPVYSASVMQKNSVGETTIYRIDVDLAELKRAQRKVQESETFYQQLFRHSSSGVTVYEPVNGGSDYIVRDINSAGEIIEQVKRTIILNHRASEVFPEMKKTGLFKLFQQVLNTGQPAYKETAIYRNGRLQSTRDNRVYLLPSGEIVCVFDDITDQKKTLEANRLMELSLQRAQKMEAIGLMAGGIAHDLNNTLSAIVGYPDLLLFQLPQDSPLQKPLKAIKAAGERAAAVVADLLTVAKGVATTRQSTDLNALVQEVIESSEFRDLQNNFRDINFSQYLAADLPKTNCSPIHVKKCIMHLVVNATEAITKAGRITLSTRTTIPDVEFLNRYGLKAGTYSVLRITDDGKGISEADLEHIFEPFYTKRAMGRPGGTGLGLSVVWNTMKDHEGAVIAQSSASQTTFDLYFPVDSDTPLAVPAPQETTEPDNVFGNGEIILVVDDEEQQRDLARNILEHYGYTVYCQSSGEKAVDFLKNHTVDLVLLDMIMTPGISGRQTYEQINRLHPQQKAIIASGFSGSEDIEATLKMGAGIFLKKPYSMKELALSVKKELTRKS